MSVSAAALLRSARQSANLSQTELARLAGVAQSVISAYESGRREPSLPTLARLIDASGHRLEIAIAASPGGERGLPDTPLARRLRQQRRAILRTADRRRARNIRVFGSVARGDDTATSDELIGYWDYGSSIAPASGETFTVDFSAANGILQVA